MDASFRHREVASSFGADAPEYDRARPSYPAELIAQIVAASPGLDVLDVGIGTGLAARLFRDARCHVLGVDVDERMAVVARQYGFDVEVSAFEDWQPAGRSFDAVVSAQAWHWVDALAGAVKAAESLRPGGVWAVFWNAFGLDERTRSAFADVYQHVVNDLPFNPWTVPAIVSYEKMTQMAIDGVSQSGLFGQPTWLRTYWRHRYTRDEWLAQVPTFGGHNRLPPEQLQALMAGLGAVIGDYLDVDYTTIGAMATRLSSAGSRATIIG